MSKNIDWSSLGFGYVQTDKRFVSNYKNGAWDDGVLTEDATVNLSECAGVLQYAQTCFEGLKAYTTEKGQIVIFRPDLNASRMADSCKRLEMPVYPEDKWVDAVVLSSSSILMSISKICVLRFWISSNCDRKDLLK